MIICHYDLRKYFFSNRIINIWNSYLKDVSRLSIIR